MMINDDLIQAVWEKGRGVLDRNTDEWRKDQCGAWIQRQQYDNTHSEFGWKIVNTSPGGPDVLENLQPFHWDNHYDIANSMPHCRVTADRTGLSPTQHTDRPRNTSA